MSLINLAGSGTTLSSNYYMRNFYISNRDARTHSKRQTMSNTDLTLADGQALRRAVRELRSSAFSKEEDVNIRNRVLAYIQTYNNTISSTSETSDRTLARSRKQLQSITNEYADRLDKIGITVNENGTLSSRDSLFNSADLSKFKELFSDDSDYMQRTLSCTKKIERHSEMLSFSKKTKQRDVAASLTLSEEGMSAGSGASVAAQLVTATLGIGAQPENAPGNHVNIVL